MKAPNHVVGGIVFTGFFGSILGYNILSSPWFLAFTAYASLFPDIDHTKSWIGKSMYPIAKWIDRKYGHRTITHSIWFLIATTSIVQLINSAFFQDGTITFIWLFANMSHLIFDMMTVQGVPLFYPVYMNAFVLPANPSKRMRTNDIRMESRVFGVFMVFLFVLQPLMSNGFWTSYNRLFGTMKHVVSEYRKSEDLLRADYRYKVASDVYEGSGYVVEISDTKAALIQNDQWKILDKSQMVVEEIIPNHTGIQFEFIYENFVAVSVDSLNEVLKDKMIMEYEFQGNRAYTLHEGPTATIQSRTKGKYASEVYIQPEATTADTDDRVSYSTSPRIRTLESKIQSLKRKYQNSEAAYQQSRVALDRLKDQYQETTDLYEKEKIVLEVKELEKIQEIPYPEYEISEIEHMILELKQGDSQKYRDRVRDLRDKKSLERVEELSFTGYIRYFKIKDSESPLSTL